MLEMLARAPLWRDGLNYLHGTGHGMGAFLNVHEGPFGVGGGAIDGHKIAANANRRRMYLYPIEAGFHLSDEPGFYRDGGARTPALAWPASRASTLRLPRFGD